MGYLNPCCLAYPAHRDEDAKQDIEKRNVLRHGVKKSFQYDYLEKVRRQMKENIWPIECSSCQKLEAAGIKSGRLYNLLKFPEIIENYKVTSMDLRLGNICNLKCRMCSPFYSIVLRDEWVQAYGPIPQEELQYYNKLNYSR